MLMLNCLRVLPEGAEKYLDIDRLIRHNGAAIQCTSIFPSVLIRAITCLRGRWPLLHHFVHSVSGGPVWDRILPLISLRRPDGEREINERGKVYNGSGSSTAKT